MILLLACSDTLHIDVIRCLINSGIKSVVLGTPETSDSALSRFCKKFYEVPQGFFHSPRDDEMINFIKDIAKKHQCNLVLPVCLHATRLLARVKDELKDFIKTFPVSTESTLKMLHDKWQFFLFLKKIGIAVPETCLINRMGDLAFVQSKLQFPVIMKPLEESGGKGVKIVDDLAKLSEELNTRSFPLILQEFIPGSDIDISVLGVEGELKAWTIQTRTDTSIDFMQNEEVLSIGKKVVNECHFNGVAHFDLRLDERDGSIKVIECNPRFWGSVYASCCVGVNFPVLGIEAVLNHKIGFRETQKEARYLLRKKLVTQGAKLWLNCSNLKQVVLYEFTVFLRDPFFNLYKFFSSRGMKTAPYLETYLTKNKVAIMAGS